ncbi:hypothetical protein [Gluconobacter kanchanaburiensis]|uniref:hypothetical protein n=1 Tax=Gluconobacter kanchanaburiensis TaxID=563199 RepID=UPI0011BFB18A|nr:hypothetical protein [Gluconobacter kanchanaburiensis]MBF0861139.1 hypothetical protein [Gluconobacter kanchanaburiensis]
MSASADFAGDRLRDAEGFSLFSSVSVTVFLRRPGSFVSTGATSTDAEVLRVRRVTAFATGASGATATASPAVFVRRGRAGLVAGTSAGVSSASVTVVDISAAGGREAEVRPRLEGAVVRDLEGPEVVFALK